MIFATRQLLTIVHMTMFVVKSIEARNTGGMSNLSVIVTMSK